MSTITVDLERVLASGKKNSYEGRAFADIVSTIARSKRVVCLTGAGISTSAGIPDFRSKDGLYQLASGSSSSTLATSGRSSSTSSSSVSMSRSSSASSFSSKSSSRSSSSSSSSRSQLKGADLFSTQVFSSAASLSKFYRFISNLNTLSASAKPTPTHHFIHTLSKKGKLLRCYTQNIDGLEEKAGLKSANPNDGDDLAISSSSSSLSSKAKGKSRYQGDLVHLHGRAGKVRCTICTYTGEWTSDISQAYKSGFSISCEECQDRLSLRKALGKRLNVAVGTLRPAITLYGEQGMEDLFISEISNADVRNKPDCLIIFGTSLKVHGFKQLAKDFAREVEENDGKVIYVNLGEPGKEWHSSINYHVQGHTDTFVQAILEEWRHIRPQDFQTQAKLPATTFAATKKSQTTITSSLKGGKSTQVAKVVNSAISQKTTKNEKAPSSSLSKHPLVEKDMNLEDDEPIVHVRSSTSTTAKTKTTLVNSMKPRDEPVRSSSILFPTSPALALPNFKKLSATTAASTTPRSPSVDLRSPTATNKSKVINATRHIDLQSEAESEDDEIEDFDDDDGMEEDEAVAVMLHSKSRSRGGSNNASSSIQRNLPPVSPSKRARPAHLSAFAAHVKRGRYESPESSDDSNPEREDEEDKSDTIRTTRRTAKPRLASSLSSAAASVSAKKMATSPSQVKRSLSFRKGRKITKLTDTRNERQGRAKSNGI